MDERTPTRQRLIAEGMRLFAVRGFRDTPVGDVETAAGLQPRRGGLYKHFATKQALLEAAVRSHIDSAEAGAIEIGGLDFTDATRIEPAILRPIVAALGRWFLDEMDRMKDLTRVLEHDGDRMEDLLVEVKNHVVDLSYRTATRLISAARPAAADPEALAVVLLGPLVALRRTTWTFASPPLGIDDNRALTAWTDLALAILTMATTEDRQ
jgi:AcrR family transcriptional regulator